MSIAMGRVVSNSLQHALHGVCVASVPTNLHDVPGILQVPQHVFEGAVLDVEEGDPAGRLLELSDVHPHLVFDRASLIPHAATNAVLVQWLSAQSKSPTRRCGSFVLA